MKNQKLVYKTGKFILLKNLEFNKLKRPIYMQRMKIDIHEDDEKNKFPLNKSQIVEYEDEDGHDAETNITIDRLNPPVCGQGTIHI